MALPATSNPYFQRDIFTILDIFGDPTAPSETDLEQLTDEQREAKRQETLDYINRKTPGQQVRDAITSLPDTISEEVGLVVLSNRLQEHMDQAAGAVESFYSYGTVQSGTSTTFNIGDTVKGIEMQNTWYTIANADNVGEAIATAVADCIPCQDRIMSLLQLNPLKDFLSHANIMYQQSIKFLVDLYDLIFGDKSVEVFNDFCSLFKFLSFMCVPDLAGMIFVLSRLMAKYAIKLKDIQISFMSIMGKISGPALSPLMATVDKYIQLIIAPVECMIAVLDAQLQKLDVVQAWEKNMQGKKAKRSFDLKGIAGPLQVLKKYLLDATSEAKEDFKKLDRAMQDLLGVQKEMDKQMFDITYSLQMCGRLIGLVQAIILALTQGTIICGPDTGDEDLKNFLNYTVAPRFDVSITMSDNEAKISPQVPDSMEKILNVIGKYQKRVSEPDLANTEEQRAVIGQVTVQVKNCLHTVTDKELDNVKDFLGTFK